MDCPFDRTFGGRTELSEYFGNHVEHPLRIGPRMHVGLDDREPDLTFGRQCARFALRGRRKIKRHDVEALLREPDAVAALTVSHR
jgi:hypothetical protein